MELQQLLVSRQGMLFNSLTGKWIFDNDLFHGKITGKTKDIFLTPMMILLVMLTGVLNRKLIPEKRTL
jgi:hypothetical protein